MASVVINGDTSGAITVAAPAVAGTNTLTLPALTGTALLASSLGTAGQILSSNGASSLPSWGSVTSPSGTLNYIKSVVVTDTTNTDVTNIGSYSSFLIAAFYNGGSTTLRNLQVAVSSNNGTSFGTAAQITVGTSNSNKPAFTWTTISNTNVTANKIIAPFSVDNVGSSFTTTTTESTVTGTINALRFNHTASSTLSAVTIFGIT